MLSFASLDIFIVSSPVTWILDLAAHRAVERSSLFVISASFMSSEDTESCKQLWFTFSQQLAFCIFLCFSRFIKWSELIAVTSSMLVIRVWGWPCPDTVSSAEARLSPGSKGNVADKGQGEGRVRPYEGAEKKGRVVYGGRRGQKKKKGNLMCW